MRPRDSHYDALESLKHRIRSLDERKLLLQTELRTSRTDQLILRQDIQQMRSAIAQVVASRGSEELNARLTHAETQMHEMNKEAANFRTDIDRLVKKIDKTREISNNAHIELDMLKLRFSKTFPHSAGEVFLPRVQTQQETNVGPAVPRVRPLSCRRPLSAATAEVSDDYDLRLGIHGLNKVVNKVLGNCMEAIKANIQKNFTISKKIKQGRIVYKGDEIAAFKDFLNTRGGFPEIYEEKEILSISKLSEIIATTGYPNSKTLSACLAVGHLVYKSKIIKTLNLDDPRLRPLPNFNFNLSSSTSMSRTMEVLKRQGSRAQTAPTKGRVKVIHHHVHVALPQSGQVQLKRVLAEISKSITTNLGKTITVD